MITETTAFVLGGILGGLIATKLLANNYKKRDKPQELTPPPAIEPSPKAKPLTEKERGDRFEEYFVRHVDSLYKREEFLLSDWRSDKYLPDIKCYPKSSSNPDIEYMHVPTGKRIAFECKWRIKWHDTKDGSDKKIDIVNTDQQYKIEGYKKYDEDPNVTTYLVIGIGWDNEKHSPYVFKFIPFSKIQYTTLSKNWLIKNEVSLDEVMRIK